MKKSGDKWTEQIHFTVKDISESVIQKLIERW